MLLLEGLLLLGVSLVRLGLLHEIWIFEVSLGGCSSALLIGWANNSTVAGVGRGKVCILRSRVGWNKQIHSGLFIFNMSGGVHVVDHEILVVCAMSMVLRSKVAW